MLLEDLQAEIAALVARLGDAPHDRQETEVVLRERLAMLEAFGMPLPQDMVDLRAALDRQLEDAARQRSRPPLKPPRT